MYASAEMEARLNDTSYAVLSLIALGGPATPYDLKRAAGLTVGNFWSLHQAQLYSEPRRLAAAGYVTEERERGGRRRRTYSITAAGEAALERWVAEPTADFTELRDPALLRLFMGASPSPLARVQADAHRQRLEQYEQMATGEMAAGPRRALEAGLRHEREWVSFWEGLAESKG
jgi:DNA-binding PadR family transcriptional regulator